jgi:hypothetical protein
VEDFIFCSKDLYLYTYLMYVVCVAQCMYVCTNVECTWRCFEKKGNLNTEKNLTLLQLYIHMCEEGFLPTNTSLTFRCRQSEFRHFAVQQTEFRHFAVRQTEFRHFVVQQTEFRHFVVRQSECRHFVARQFGDIT